MYDRFYTEMWCTGKQVCHGHSVWMRWQKNPTPCYTSWSPQRPSKVVSICFIWINMGQIPSQSFVPMTSAANAKHWIHQTANDKVCSNCWHEALKHPINRSIEHAKIDHLPSTTQVIPSHEHHVRLSKLLVQEKDINIIWKGPIANHSFVALLPSWWHIDLHGVSLRLNAAKVDMILHLYQFVILVVSVI